LNFQQKPNWQVEITMKNADRVAPKNPAAASKPGELH
jgi:hypothetical protein